MIDLKKHFPCIALALLFTFMNTLKAQPTIINELSTLNGGFLPRAAWSIRKLCTNCNGPLVRVRHGIHNAIADVAPDSSGNISISSLVTVINAGNSTYGVAQTTTLGTFAAGAFLFVTTWYDQSGHNYHITQNNPANQPRLLLNSGINNRGALSFTASSNQCLSIQTGVIPTQSISRYTLNAVWKTNTTNYVGVVCEQNQNSYTHSRRASMLMYTGTYGFNGELNDAHALATVAANETIITSVVTDNSQLNNITLYKNASVAVNGSTSGNHSILNVGTDIFAVGKKGSTNTEYWDGNIAEILVFDQAFQAPIQRRMLGNQGHYFRVPTSAPTPPISLSATRNNATVVNLIWVKPTSDGGSDITDYTIEYKKHTDSSWLTYNDGISVNTICSISNLLPDAAYDFRVSAVNSIGAGEAATTSTISNPLPLKWLGFEGYLEEPNIGLKWTTALEYNCSHFEIERSFADKESFQTIGRIHANGSCLSQTYIFTDSNITNGYSTSIFYRIKQVDINADYTYSNIIRLITAATDVEEIQIVPNPTTLQTIYISIPESYGDQHEATLSDEAGKRIVTFHITGSSSFYTLTGLHLKPGIYSLTFNSGGTYHHRKLVIIE